MPSYRKLSPAQIEESRRYNREYQRAHREMCARLGICCECREPCPVSRCEECVAKGRVRRELRRAA